MNLKNNRTAAVGLSAAMLVTLGGVGGAFAADAIGSRDIKDDSIRSVDVKDGGLGFRDFNDHTQDRINQPGPKGEKGEPGLSNVAADGPYTTTWKGDNGATLQEAVVKCDAGQTAIGGGFSGAGGKDDLGTEAYKAIDIVVSAPYTDDYKPVNDRGSFQPNEWVVKGFNNSTTDMVVRPWVVCADTAQK